MTADGHERAHRAEILGLGPRRIVARRNRCRARRPADVPPTSSGLRTACRVLRAARPPEGPRTRDTSLRWQECRARASSPATCGRRRCRSATATPAGDRARTSSCNRSAGTSRRSSRSTRSIFARSRTSRTAPSSPVKVNAPSSSYSISRSRMPVPRSASIANTRSTMPEPTAEPNNRARSRPASAGGSDRSAGPAISSNNARASAHVRRGDAAAAPRLPFVEERFEQLVEESPALERRARGFIFRFLGDLQHVGHVELERALHVALEPADADARQHPLAGLAFESARIAFAALRRAHAPSAIRSRADRRRALRS